MAAQDKTTFEGTFNNSSTGLFKTNTTKDIGSDDLRTLVENLTDSVPFNEDDKYTWASPQVTASGTNTYTATPSPAISAYATGQEFKIKFTNASTGVSTLNLNGLGAKKIFINPTTQATTDHILAGQIVKLAYDAALDSASGGFLMLGSAATSGGAVDSVNGETGVVVLDAADVGADPAGTAAAAVVGLAPLASPTFTGTPAAPTPSPGDNDTSIATTAFVTAAVAATTNVVDQVSTSTAGGTITLDMNSQVQRSHVGSASFNSAKIIAMSNTTNSLFFNFLFEVTSVSAVITFPSDWICSSFDFNGTTWTPPETGRFEFGGSHDAINNLWYIKVSGDFV